MTPEMQTPRRRRRATAAVLATLLALGLSACGGDDDDAEAPDPTAGVTAAEAPSEETPEGAPPGVDDAAVTSAEPLQVPLAARGATGAAGTATLIPIGEGLTRVIVRVEGAPGGVAHLHRGACAQPDPEPAQALTDVADGVSETFLPVSLAALRSEPFVIDVHDPADPASYVSCGAVPAA